MATTLVLFFCVVVYLITEWDNVRVRADLRHADRKLATNATTIADLTTERDQARAEADDLTEYAESLEAALFGPQLAKPHLAAVPDDEPTAEVIQLARVEAARDLHDDRINNWLTNWTTDNGDAS